MNRTSVHKLIERMPIRPDDRQVWKDIEAQAFKLYHELLRIVPGGQTAYSSEESYRALNQMRCDVLELHTVALRMIERLDR